MTVSSLPLNKIIWQLCIVGACFQFTPKSKIIRMNSDNRELENNSEPLNQGSTNSKVRGEEI